MRAVRPGDDAALSEICLRTADHGSDATGLFDDDDIWGAIFVLPYAERHPDFAFVVADDDNRPIGYVVATPDTDAFEEGACPPKSWKRWRQIRDKLPELSVG